MSDISDPDRPWGDCPRCTRPLVRDQLPLQTWPTAVSMQGPPVCPVCTAAEIERYLKEWEPPEPEEQDSPGSALG